jgi:hypothetical protein
MNVASYPKLYDKVVIAAIRWQENRKECRRLLAELRPCEDELGPDPETGDPGNEPCWKRYDEGPPEPCSGYQDPIPHPLCPACQHNADHIVPALKAARARRGGLTSALAKAVDRFTEASCG